MIKTSSTEPQGLQKILALIKKPLDSSAVINATRKCLVAGGLTKFNRVNLFIPKTHALDAACVGRMSELKGWAMPVFNIKATGWGAYQRTRVTKKGFPRGYLPRTTARGFRTGDLVEAAVPRGKKRGCPGFFNIQTPQGSVQGVSSALSLRLSRRRIHLLSKFQFPPMPEVKGFLEHSL